MLFLGRPLHRAQASDDRRERVPTIVMGKKPPALNAENLANVKGHFKNKIVHEDLELSFYVVTGGTDARYVLKFGGEGDIEQRAKNFHKVFTLDERDISETIEKPLQDAWERMVHLHHPELWNVFVEGNLDQKQDATFKRLFNEKMSGLDKKGLKKINQKQSMFQQVLEQYNNTGPLPLYTEEVVFSPEEVSEKPVTNEEASEELVAKEEEPVTNEEASEELVAKGEKSVVNEATFLSPTIRPPDDNDPLTPPETEPASTAKKPERANGEESDASPVHPVPDADIQGIVAAVAATQDNPTTAFPIPSTFPFVEGNSLAALQSERDEIALAMPDIQEIKDLIQEVPTKSDIEDIIRTVVREELAKFQRNSAGANAPQTQTAPTREVHQDADQEELPDILKALSEVANSTHSIKWGTGKATAPKNAIRIQPKDTALANHNLYVHLWKPGNKRLTSRGISMGFALFNNRGEQMKGRGGKYHFETSLSLRLCEQGELSKILSGEQTIKDELVLQFFGLSRKRSATEAFINPVDSPVVRASSSQGVTLLPCTGGVKVKLHEVEKPTGKQSPSRRLHFQAAANAHIQAQVRRAPDQTPAVTAEAAHTPAGEGRVNTGTRSSGRLAKTPVGFYAEK